MNRITRPELECRVRYIAKKTGKALAIDHYSPGGNPFTYKLVTVNDDFSVHEWTNYRMTIREFYAYLCGMIGALDN